MHLAPVMADHNLVVRVPRGEWPLGDQHAVPRAALAADLLESREARARRAGAHLLNSLANRYVHAR
jgi:hypothetical protein